MTIRAAIGKTITRKRRKATLCLENPLFPDYNLSTATNYADNAHETEENGPYGQVFAIFRTFFRSTKLIGRKTAKNSNKGFQPTTHKLLARHTLSLATHPYGTVSGSRLTPDVQINTDYKRLHQQPAMLSNGQRLFPNSRATAGEFPCYGKSPAIFSMVWKTGRGYTAQTVER